MNAIQPEFTHSSGIFVNREPEIEMVEKIIERQSPKRIFEISGISGQGKTELLKEAYNIAVSRKIVAAFIDFEEGKYRTEDILPALEHLSKQLFGKTGNFQREFSNFLNETEKIKEALVDEPENVDLTLVDNLKSSLIEQFKLDLLILLRDDQKKVVICLDSLEKAPPEALRCFETSVLWHAIQNDNFFLITAGQKTHQWSSSHIRNKSHQHDLKPLNRNNTQKFLRKLAEKKLDVTDIENHLLDKTFALTSGHPYFTFKFLEYIFESAGGWAIKDTVDTQFPRGTESLIGFIIEQVQENWTMKQEYPSIEKILLLISPLRKMEYGTFHFMLTNFMEGGFEENSPFYFQTLLGELLEKTYLFVPKGLGGGYDMDQVVRNILLTHLHVNNESLYLEIQQTLADKYDFWVATSTDVSQIKHMIERLYHLVMANKGDMSINVDEIAENQLRMYLKTYITLTNLESNTFVIEQCNRLKAALKSDEELRDMIDVNQLVGCIDSHLSFVVNKA